jgi:hypothetical protein
MGVKWISGAEEDPATQQIHLEVSHLEGRLVGFVGGARGVAQGHADPGQQLAGAERLADVVVSSRVEGRYLVALLTAGREHDDRHGTPLAQPSDHLQAVHVG